MKRVTFFFLPVPTMSIQLYFSDFVVQSTWICGQYNCHLETFEYSSAPFLSSGKSAGFLDRHKAKANIQGSRRKYNRLSVNVTHIRLYRRFNRGNRQNPYPQVCLLKGKPLEVKIRECQDSKIHNVEIPEFQCLKKQSHPVQHYFFFIFISYFKRLPFTTKKTRLIELLYLKSIVTCKSQTPVIGPLDLFDITILDLVNSSEKKLGIFFMVQKFLNLEKLTRKCFFQKPQNQSKNPSI